MNPWKTLNIKATKDKKAIKKAYAVLLKKYKPDECPVEFQEIQQAYKLALSWSPSVPKRESVASVATEAELTFEHQPFIRKSDVENIEVKQISELLALSETDAPSADELKKELMQQVHVLAFSPLKVKDDLQNWKFIEEFILKIDIQHMRALAIELFEKVAEYNLFQMKQNSTLLIAPKVFEYLNDVFDWEDLLNNYNYQYSQDVYDVTFYYLDHKKNSRIKNNSKSIGFMRIAVLRIYSQFWDVFYSLLPLGLLIIIFPNFKTFIDTYVGVGLAFFVFYNFQRSLMELFLNKRCGFGKTMHNLIVIDSYGNSPPKGLIIKRQLLFQISLLPFYMMLFNKESLVFQLYLLVFLSIFIVQILFLSFKKCYLHDYFSKTLVVRKETHISFS